MLLIPVNSPPRNLSYVPKSMSASLKKGKATVLNLGINRDNDFQMLVYAGEICEKIHGSDDIDMPYFHFKPDLGLEEFLTEYGLAGGTHHVAMTGGNRNEELIELAKMLQLDIVVMM